MTDDELLARADDAAYQLVNAGYEVAAQLVTDLAGALRAALATQPQPPTALEIVERLNASITFGDGTHPDDALRLIADEEGPEAAVQAVLDELAAVAGSATPTTENDDGG
jgi:hypothetical protein